jgi:hypothetical protein
MAANRSAELISSSARNGGELLGGEVCQLSGIRLDT